MLGRLPYLTPNELLHWQLLQGIALVTIGQIYNALSLQKVPLPNTISGHKILLYLSF